MTISNQFRGIIHGNVIELTNDPGLGDGQVVEVRVRPIIEPKRWGDGLRRSAGALADSWTDEDDAILADIQADRKRSRDRELPQ